MDGKRRVGRAIAAGTIAIGLMASACGDSSGGGGGAYGAGAGGSTSSGASTGATGASGGYHSGSGSGGGATGSSGSGGGGGGGVRTVKQVNYQFSPAKVTVTSGDTITISDTNPSTPHTFTIDGTAIDVSNNPQQSQDVTIDLDPGTYTFYCRFHRSLGMEGTLVVK